MTLRHLPRAALALPLLAAVACGGITRPATAGPAPMPTAPRTSAPALPPVPEVDGPLSIRVVYPRPNQVVTSRDSNFIFGSVGSGRATLTINGAAVPVYPNGAFLAFLVNPPASAPQYDFVVTRAAETARTTHVIRYPAAASSAAGSAVVSPERDSAAVKPEAMATTRADSLAALNARVDSLHSRMGRDDPVGWVQLGQPSPADSDRTIVGRPVPGGTYKWFFLPGTVVPLISRANGVARVRLDRDLDVYVDSAQAIDAPEVTAAPRRVASNMRVRGSAQGVDVVIPMGQRPPFIVEQTDRSLQLTLYGVRANTDIINYAAGDSMIRTVDWVQTSNDRSTVTVNLRAAPYGYLVVWEGNALVLKLRGRPAIDRSNPLRGLTIAVDAGHPPGGATGPTGLWEPQATLPISERLRAILQQRGARVVMTRVDSSSVALEDRPIIARRANAHAFVSIHLNAYADGTNPFVAPGTGTYFFRAQSEPLARDVQRGMVSQLGLQDLGVYYDNLAVVRGTWYPAVLCEGAFLMLPDQEAALRTASYQERYARGVADGLEAFFRALPSR